MQSELLDLAWGSDTSLAVSAPTGAGKTVIFELAMLRMLQTAGCVDASGRFVRRPGLVKAVYVAPMRVRCCRPHAWRTPLNYYCIPLRRQAIVQERLKDWSARFGVLGLTCVEVTGDSAADVSTSDMRAADIMCACVPLSHAPSLLTHARPTPAA